MKKTLLIVGVTVAILGAAVWSDARGPGFGYGSGPGLSHMGPGMHGAWHMGEAEGPVHGPWHNLPWPQPGMLGTRGKKG
jgi:hypothetical protein